MFFRLVSFITHVLTKKTELLTRVERRILYEQTTYDQLKQIIATQSSPPIFFVRWGQHASVADVAQAANDFQKLEKSLHIEPYLHIFRKRQFPLAPDKLLELARSVNPSIAQAAVNALELIKHPAIRSLALEFAQARDKSIEAIQLLVNNYQNGDYKLIQTIIASTQDKDELHAIAMNVLDIFNITHTNEATEVLLTLYERNPCSICRRKLVELLISLNTLPNEIAHECQHDAQDSLREIITHYPTRSRA